MQPFSEPNVETAILDAWPWVAWRDVHVVLAVSGGADSVAMLRAMQSLKQQTGGLGSLHVAHLNHQLRGDGADADQAWLENLCRQISLPLEVGRANIKGLAQEEGDGWEAAARQARYAFLQQSAERVGARWVITAHTADDQAETVLHRILRGTGLAGLSGISPVRPLSSSVSLVRPLLAVSRRSILQYLETLEQDYRTDPTNEDQRFTRNRLRHDLLPKLRAEYNRSVDESLRRLASQAGEAQRRIASLAASLVEEWVTISPSTETVSINCPPLANQDRLLLREVCKEAWQQAGWPLQAMGWKEWHQLAQMVLAKEGPAPVNLPGGIRAERQGDSLRLQPIRS